MCQAVFILFWFNYVRYKISSYVFPSSCFCLGTPLGHILITPTLSSPEKKIREPVVCAISEIRLSSLVKHNAHFPLCRPATNNPNNEAWRQKYNPSLTY